MMRVELASGTVVGRPHRRPRAAAKRTYTVPGSSTVRLDHATKNHPQRTLFVIVLEQSQGRDDSHRSSTQAAPTLGVARGVGEPLARCVGNPRARPPRHPPHTWRRPCTSPMCRVQDSRHLLDHLARQAITAPNAAALGRRELPILLYNAMMQEPVKTGTSKAMCGRALSTTDPPHSR